MRDQHDDKKRALVMGKFKFLFQDETEDLEAGDKFQLAIVQNKLLGKFRLKSLTLLLNDSCRTYEIL